MPVYIYHTQKWRRNIQHAASGISEDIYKSLYRKKYHIYRWWEYRMSYMFRKGMNKMSSTYKCIKDEKWVRFTFNRAYIYTNISLHPLKYIFYIFLITFSIKIPLTLQDSKTWSCVHTESCTHWHLKSANQHSVHKPQNCDKMHAQSGRVKSLIT